MKTTQFKSLSIPKTLIGLSLLTAGSSMGAVITATNFDFRPNNFTSGVYSSGTIGWNGTSPAVGNAGATPSFNFTWSGLDIDGVGGNDDTLSFSVTVSIISGGTAVNFDAQGLGVLPGGLQAGDSLSLTINNVTSSVGSAAFNGFSAASFGTSATAGAGNLTSATGSASINGITVNNTINGTAYQYVASKATFTGLSNTVAIDNVVLSDLSTGTAVPTGWLRGLDLQFTTDPVPEPSSLALFGLGGLALLGRRRR